MAALSSPVLTPEKFKQTVAMAKAITHPKETFNNTKTAVKQWSINLMSPDPKVAGNTFGEGVEFGFEIFLPIKGLQGLKSSSIIMAEGNNIINNALKDGVQLIVAKSADDLKYLDAMGAKALYMGEEGRKGSILVSEEASRPQILEEAIHHEQRMKYGDDYFYKNVSKLEVEAQEQLIRIGKKEGWKTSEIKEIEKAKSTWEKKIIKNK